MAVTTWSPGQVLAAQDLNDTFASKLPYSYGTATPSTTDSGFLWYDSNSTPAAPKFWDGAAFQPLGGKILQIVRSTNGTNRSTTSTSFVDVTGSSVTITPTLATSAIIVMAFFYVETPSTGQGQVQITDSSNNALSGAERSTYQVGTSYLSTLGVCVGYSTPATTSATTYKLRFQTSTGTFNLYNSLNTGQMYAIEVSA